MSYSQIVCNLNVREDIKNLVSKVEKEIGNIDILINNAGITKDQLAMRMADNNWDEVLETNLYASFYLSKSVLRNMMKKKFGRIIQISSVVGFTGNPGQDFP